MKKDNKFKFAHFNIRSVRTGFDMFSDVVAVEDFDIVGISETWLDEDDNIFLPNYNLVKNSRINRGGGVAFFIKKSIKYKILTQSNNDNHLEHVWISTKIAGKTFCLGSLYRPPTSNLNHCLEELERDITAFMPVYDYILCGGDLNIDFLDTSKAGVNVMTNFLNKYNLHQLISEPTRVTDASMTLLDLIISSNLDIIHNTDVLRMDDISDHRLVLCNLNIYTNKQNPVFKTYRDYGKFNYENFLFDLHSFNWDLIYSLENVDDMVEFWNTNITLLFDVHAPLKTVRITKSPAPWLTENLRLLMSLRDKAFAKFKRLKTDALWNEYKALRNLVNMNIKSEKRAYLQHKFQTNLKEFWKTLRYLNINNKTEPSVMNFKDPDEFNNFFIHNVPQMIASNDDSIFLQKYVGSTYTNGIDKFKFRVVSTEEVEKAFRSIRSNARGVDNIDLKMLDLVLPHLSEYLTFIINKCLTGGVFPKVWKDAYVIPLQKTSNPKHLTDFRPISILPTVSKVLEKIIAEQLTSFVHTSGIIPDTQSGFRRDHSTATALLNVTDDLFRGFDKGENTCLILLDYSKAFDTLIHTILCNKLKYFCFSDNAINFFENYLSSRRQSVVVNSTYSSFVVRHAGVPQGSILGPLLFTIYTADFGNFLKFCNVHQYADDTQLYYSFVLSDLHTACQHINADLDRIAAVSRAHGLVLNGSKTNCMVTGRNRHLISSENGFRLSIQNQELKISDSCKNLGLYLDADLRFEPHVRNLIKICYLKLRTLYMCKDILTTSLRLKLCDAFILSVISYCDIVFWPTLLNKDKTTLQIIQNACIRFAFGLRKFDHITREFQLSEWLNLNERYQLHMLTFLNKLEKSHKPPYLHAKLTLRRNIHNRTTRTCDLYSVPKHNTATFQRSFSYNAVKLYNDLPPYIKQIQSFVTFRKHVKHWLINKR